MQLENKIEIFSSNSIGVVLYFVNSMYFTAAFEMGMKNTRNSVCVTVERVYGV